MASQKNDEGGRSHEVDFGDSRVVDAWLVEVDTDLDDSDRQALAEEISRQFRRSPAGVPNSGLESGAPGDPGKVELGAPTAGDSRIP